jgi:hypothetical protein
MCSIRHMLVATAIYLLMGMAANHGSFHYNQAFAQVNPCVGGTCR